MNYTENIIENGSTSDTVSASQYTPTTVGDKIIRQLRGAGFFAGVAGAASLAAFGTDEAVNLPLPAAYVVPVGTKAEPNGAQVGYWQRVTRTFAIILALDNTPEKNSLSGIRGQFAIQNIDTIEANLRLALCNWRIDPTHEPKGVELTEGEILLVDGARVWVKYQFSYAYWLGNADVFQVTGNPLTQINVTYQNCTNEIDQDITL